MAFKIIYKGGDMVQEKTIFASNIIRACTIFSGLYPYKIIKAFPVNDRGPVASQKIA